MSYRLIIAGDGIEAAVVVDSGELGSKSNDPESDVGLGAETWSGGIGAAAEVDGGLQYLMQCSVQYSPQ